MTPRTRGFAIALVGALLLDQVSKFAVWTQLEEHRDEVVLVPGFLSIVHAQNPNAAFGMMAGVPGRRWIFLGFVGVVTAAIGLSLRRIPENEALVGASLGLMLSGALGNGIDRLHKGTVTDMVKVHVGSGPVHDWLVATVGTSEWPTFNVADSALLIGVGVFVVRLAAADEEPEEEGGDASGSGA